MAQQALGLIETRGFVGVAEAADAAVKAAPVQVSGYEKIEGGLCSIRFLGDVGAVQAAVSVSLSPRGGGAIVWVVGFWNEGFEDMWVAGLWNASF